MLLAEEDSATINDGLFAAVSDTSQGGKDLLSIRHDRQKTKPDPAPDDAKWPLTNPERRGNAAFADGHAEYITRSELHTGFHLDPYRAP